MTKDPDELNPAAWLLLRDARALVAEHTKSTAAAQRLLCSHLADGRIRWQYAQCCGDWQPLDPIADRSPSFWRPNLPYDLTIDWDASSATRTGPPNTIITAGADASQPDGRTLSAEDLKLLRTMMLRGKLPATHYTVDLIRLHRDDVAAMLRSVGLVASAPPTPIPVPAAAPPPMVPAKKWLPDATKKHPRGPDETAAAYARRLAGLMPERAVKPETIERRLRDEPSQGATKGPPNPPAKPRQNAGGPRRV